MTPTARHRTVEAEFRALAEARGLDPPDAVEYRSGAVAFFWHAPRVVVEVDFAPAPLGAGGRAPDAAVRHPRPRSARRPE